MLLQEGLHDVEEQLAVEVEEEDDEQRDVGDQEDLQDLEEDLCDTALAFLTELPLRNESVPRE